MPIFYIPIGTVPNNAPRNAGDVVGGTVVDQGGLTVTAPGVTIPILQSWTLTGVALPLTIQATQNSGASPPNNASLVVNFNVSGQQVFAVEVPIGALQNANFPGSVITYGSTVVSEDFVNPIELGPGHKLTFEIFYSFDVGIPSPGISQAGLACRGVSFTPVPAPVRYSVEYAQQLRRSNA